MSAWIYRARDLSIISETTAKRLFKLFSSKGWKTREPGDPIPPESPQRMKRLILQSLAERVISEPRATELLGEPIRPVWQEAAGVYEHSEALRH